MSTNGAHEDAVLVSLSTMTPDNIAHPERRILLTESQPRMYIGRSSNRANLGLLPDISNGWFDSPVMSRHHAEIEADLQKQIVNIRDAGSMHGTYLNNEKVGSDQARPLRAGDNITFGLPVYRNQTIFKPATMTVGMEYRNTRANHPPSRIFTVPDDCSTDENFDEHEPIEDDISKGRSSVMDQQGNVETREHCLLAISQMDGPIEIDSDAAPNDHISISSDDVMCSDGINDEDDESISLTDDEKMSSTPGSPMDSVEPDDTVQMDEDGTRSPSWNRLSAVSESEHTDEDTHSTRLISDDEHGVFLYDSDSEEMDELDDDEPLNTDVDSCMQGNDAFSVPSLPERVAPMLPSLATAVFSQSQYPDICQAQYPAMPFGYKLPPVVQSAHRQPSPSDAVLPLSHRHHGSEDDGVTTGVDLGGKWGKTEFFEAREHNKMTVSRMTEPNPSSGGSLVIDAAKHDATTEVDLFSAVYKDLEEHIASSAMKIGTTTGIEPSQDTSLAAGPEQHATRPPEGQKPSPWSSEAHEQSMSLPGTQAPHSAPITGTARKSPVPEPAGASLGPHLHEDPTVKLVTSTEADGFSFDWTPTSAFVLQQTEQSNAQKDQELGARGDLTDKPLASDSHTRLPQATPKGKRKASEISETTQQELAWHETGNVRPAIVPTTPVMQAESDAHLPSPPTTPEQRDSADARPSRKIRKIAERVGYAALGGATVGAMVFTSLIYTAPSFA